MTVGRTQTALGAFYRRLSARVGKAKAVTATARKIATLFYNTLRHGIDYADPGASYYEDRYRARVLANLRRQGRSVLRSVTGDLGFPRAEMSEFIRDNPNRRLSHAGVAIGDFALDP